MFIRQIRTSHSSSTRPNITLAEYPNRAALLAMRTILPSDAISRPPNPVPSLMSTAMNTSTGPTDEAPMQTIRTPDERFANLIDYPFAAHYVDVPDGEGGELRIHYLDEGPAAGQIILCLHGQPTWSYLYRRMIAPLSGAGYRVVAPDLVGFGKSDKPTQPGSYSYANHVRWIDGFVKALDLRAVTLVCQDWGGLIGLRVLTDNVERFARVVAANTGLPDAHGIPAEAAPMLRTAFAKIPALPPEQMVAKLVENENGLGFMYWIKYCAEYPDFRISDAVRLSAMNGLTDAQVAAYDAPFPSEAHKQGARRFPSLVPIFPDDPAIEANRRAWAGARRQQHVTIDGAGHFLQEDAPDRLAAAIVDFCRGNPL
jgi:haloalkane dehalogenase